MHNLNLNNSSIDIDQLENDLLSRKTALSNNFAFALDRNRINNQLSVRQFLREVKQAIDNHAAALNKARAKNLLKTNVQNNQLDILDDLSELEHKAPNTLTPYTGTNKYWNRSKDIITSKFNIQESHIKNWNNMSKTDIKQNNGSSVSGKYVVKCFKKGTRKENPANIVNCTLIIPDLSILLLPPSHDISPKKHVDNQRNRTNGKTTIRSNGSSTEDIVADAIASILQFSKPTTNRKLLTELNKMTNQKRLKLKPSRNSFVAKRNGRSGPAGLTLNGLALGKAPKYDLNKRKAKQTVGQVFTTNNQKAKVQSTDEVNIYVITHASPKVI